MLERLEKFEAPPARHWLLALPMIGMVLLACNVDKQTLDLKQAEASGRAGTATLPMAFPLGCSEEDEAGRKLTATLSIKGERRPRCIYTSEITYGRR